MPQSFDDQKKASQGSQGDAAHDGGPGADALKSQGAAAGARIAGLDKMSKMPVGIPLKVVSGSLKGHPLLSGSGQLSLDPDTMKLVLSHASLKAGFITISDDTLTLTVVRNGDSGLDMSFDEKAHSQNVRSRLKMTADPTSGGVTFTDEQSGDAGSIRWDDATHQLTMKMGENVVVLAPG